MILIHIYAVYFPTVSYCSSYPPYAQRSARYKTFHLPNKEIPHPDYYSLSTEANLSHCIPILLRPTKQKIHIFSIDINDKSIISSNVNQLIELLFKLSSSSPTSNIPERAAAPVRGKSQILTLPALLRRMMQIFHRFKDDAHPILKGQSYQTVGRWSALGRRRRCNSVHGSGWRVGAATANS